MNCISCGKTNLPGGVRCVYCGAPFPPRLDFEIGTVPSSPPIPPRSTPSATRTQPQNTRRGGLAGTLALLALKAKTIFTLVFSTLKFGKILLTLGTMFLSIVVYSRLFGWAFATGFVVCILIHEMGHVVMNAKHGIKATAPMFIPFMGAVIFLKSFPQNPEIESESGAGGPAAGLLAALVCFLLGLLTGNPFWFALAKVGAFINLFNMLPFPPLDGSHIGTVFSPRIWGVVLVTMLLWVIKLGFGPTVASFAGMNLFILMVGLLFRLGGGDKTRHLLAPPVVRVRMAFVFVGLCVGLTYLGAASTARLAAMHVATTSTTSTTASETQATDADTDTTASDSQQTPHQSSTRISDSVELTVRLILVGALFLGALCIWLLTAYLLTIAASTSFTAHRLALVGGMLTVLLIVLLQTSLMHTSANLVLLLISAYCLASLTALVFAGYAAYHKSQYTPQGITLMTFRALCWTAGGALIVAYAFNNLPIAGYVLLLALLYLGVQRWIVPYLIATTALALMQTEKAMDQFGKALALRPPQDTACHLWSELAGLQLRFSRGEAALQALEGAEAARRGTGATPNTVTYRTVQELWLRSSALMLLDRYDESLACIEQMLQAPAHDPGASARLPLARIRLAELARLRGWSDESLAQVNQAQAHFTSAGRNFIARLRTLRARAFAATNQGELAEAECAEALAQSQDKLVLTWVACARTEILLQANNPSGAQQALQPALQEAGADIEVRYLKGSVLFALGRQSAALAEWKSLSTQFPREHWGRQAAVRLEQN